MGGVYFLRLSTIEKNEGVHGDIRVPILSVQSVIMLNDVIENVHGIKMLTRKFAWTCEKLSAFEKKQHAGHAVEY